MKKNELEKFISSNISLLDEYDLSKIYLDVLSKKLSEHFQTFISKEILNCNISFEENCKLITNEITKHFSSLEEFRLYKNFKYPMDKIYKFENDTITQNGLSNYNLIYILFYIVNNKVYDDYTEANELQKACNLNYDTSSFDFTNFNGTFGNVFVKKFKNGKITFKGLTEKQKNKLSSLFETCRKGKLSKF